MTTTAPPTLTLGSQRVFHVTHFRNFEAIVVDGEIRADATPELDVSSETTRELRAAADLASGASVAQHVAFYATPDAARWDELRRGGVGTHWSDAARQTSALDYVVLAVPARELGPEVVVTDGDAAAAATRFAHGQDDGTAMLRRAHAVDPELREVEVLSPVAVGLEMVALIGVANEPMRERVRELLRDSGGHEPRIAVFPPWFQPGE